MLAFSFIAISEFGAPQLGSLALITSWAEPEEAKPSTAVETVVVTTGGKERVFATAEVAERVFATSEDGETPFEAA